MANFKADPNTSMSVYVHKALYPKFIAPVQEFKPLKVLVLGSGGLTIGQAGEFDYSGIRISEVRLHSIVHAFVVKARKP